MTRISMALSARRWRRFGVQGHSDSLRRLCAATTAWQGHRHALQGDGKAQRRHAWQGQCMALASKGKAHHRRATAKLSKAWQGRSEALRRVRGRGIALRSGGMALACKAVRGQSTGCDAMARGSRAAAQESTATAQYSDETLGRSGTRQWQGRASRAALWHREDALGHGGARPVQVCIGNRKSRR